MQNNPFAMTGSDTPAVLTSPGDLTSPAAPRSVWDSYFPSYDTVQTILADTETHRSGRLSVREVRLGGMQYGFGVYEDSEGESVAPSAFQDAFCSDIGCQPQKMGTVGSEDVLTGGEGYTLVESLDWTLPAIFFDIRRALDLDIHATPHCPLMCYRWRSLQEVMRRGEDRMVVIFPQAKMANEFAENVTFIDRDEMSAGERQRSEAAEVVALEAADRRRTDRETRIAAARLMALARFRESTVGTAETAGAAIPAF